MKYDVIVIGAGTMGSSACAYLAQRGLKVLGLEQFTIPHDLGSHSGYTRIIRQAYYEHPSYVPLLQKSYQLWKELETKMDRKLYHETGILYLGEPTSSVLNGTLEASGLYDIPVSEYELNQVNGQYPDFEFPNYWKALWEPHAGYLNVNQALTGFFKVASEAGAKFCINEKVLSWKKLDHHVEVNTTNQTYTADKLILTAGSWTSELTKTTPLPLKVTRQVLAWIDVPHPEKYAHPNFPCWFLHDPERGMYYGFPESMTGDPAEPPGIKLALHMPGTASDPDKMDRSISLYDESVIQYFLETYMPGLKSYPIRYKTCMYTYTPDENFIIDYLPGMDKKVMLAGGFSGHGFKFAPVIGELLTDLCLEQPISMNIDFLKLSRFQNL